MPNAPYGAGPCAKADGWAAFWDRTVQGRNSRRRGGPHYHHVLLPVICNGATASHVEQEVIDHDTATRPGGGEPPRTILIIHGRGRKSPERVFVPAAGPTPIRLQAEHRAVPLPVPPGLRTDVPGDTTLRHVVGKI